MVGLKDKLFEKKDRLLDSLSLRPPEFRRRHPKLRLEAAVERDRIGETTGLAKLLNSKLGVFVQETDSIVEAQLADEGGESLVARGLGEGGPDALLREARAVDERLALEVRVEKQLLALDEVAEVVEEVGIGESLEFRV